ncbi:MAG: hypothetical protein Q7K35_00385 [bacterium]|nr:hypothetical protein [bacterium]
MMDLTIKRKKPKTTNQKKMKEITAYFQKLPGIGMAILDWPEITLPTRGFNVKEGVLYTYTKVGHPEEPRLEYQGKRYIVYTATPVQARQEIGGMENALAKLGL